MLCSLGVDDNTLKTAAHFRGYVCLNDNDYDKKVIAPVELCVPSTNANYQV